MFDGPIAIDDRTERTETCLLLYRIYYRQTLFLYIRLLRPTLIQGLCLVLHLIGVFNVDSVLAFVFRSGTRFDPRIPDERND